MAELEPSGEHEPTLALLAQAELEHFRCGLMRLCLLFAAALYGPCVLAVPMRQWTSPLVLAAGLGGAVVGLGGTILAIRASSRLYWQLGRHPWQAIIAAAIASVIVAVEGLGTSLIYFPALTLIVLLITIGQPGWGWTTAGLLLLAPNVFAVLLHAAGMHTGQSLLSEAAILQDVGVVGATIIFWRLIEYQARHVPSAFIQMMLVPSASRTMSPFHEPGTPPPRSWEPEDGRKDPQPHSGRKDGGSPLALPAPPHQLDVAELARVDLGLTSRELEVMLLMLAGVEEAEIGLRLPHAAKRSRAVSRSTVNKHIESAKHKLARVHDLPAITTAQAAALTQSALDHYSAQANPSHTAPVTAARR